MSPTNKVITRKKSKSKGLPGYFQQYRVRYFILFLVIIIVYSQAFFFTLGKLDEFNIIVNNLAFLSDFHNLKEAFLNNPFFNRGGDFYRPLQNISFMIDAHISGSEGWGYYLTNILLHSITCCLIYYLLKLSGGEKRIPFLLTLLYAVHPLFVQTVAWSPSRGDLLMAVFGLISIITFIKYIRSGNLRFAIIHIVSFGLALLSKEAAIAIPVIFGLWYFFIEKEKKVNPVYLLITLLFYILIIAVFFYIRIGLVKIEVPTTQFGFIPLIKNLRTIPEFIFKFFIPVGLSPMPGFDWSFTIIGILLMTLLAGSAIKSYSGSGKLPAFGLAWFLLFTIPALAYINIFGSAACDYMEHRAYVPSIGILIFINQFLVNNKHTRTNKNIPVYLMFLIIIFGIYSFTYSRNYRTPVAFYDRSISTNPASAVAVYCRGTVVMQEEKKYPEAIRDFEQALRIKPDYARAFLNRGFCREQLNDIDGAMGDYIKASRLNPLAYEPHFDMASLKNSQGLPLEALKEYDTVLKLYPVFYQGFTERAKVRLSLKDTLGALSDLDKAIRLSDQYPEAYLQRGVLRFQTLDDRGALADLNRAILLDDQYPEAYLDRGILKFQSGEFTEALIDLNRSILLNSQFAEAYLNRGRVRYFMNDMESACDDWNTADKLGNKEAGKLILQYCK